MSRLVPLLLCLLLIVPSQATAELKPLTLVYDVSRNDFFLGSTKRVLKQLQPGVYEIQATTKAEGLAALFVSDVVTEQSRFKVTEQGVQPLYYRYHKSGDEPEQFSVSYNYKNHTLTHSWLKETVPLSGKDQDLISFQVATMQALQYSIRPLHFRIADKEHINEYDLIPRGKKVFDTRLGKLHTVVMQYYDKRKNQTFTFWCAKELDYWPYQSQKRDSDGDIIQLRLRSYNGKSAGLKQQEEDY